MLLESCSWFVVSIGLAKKDLSKTDISNNEGYGYMLIVDNIPTGRRELKPFYYFLPTSLALVLESSSHSQ